VESPIEEPSKSDVPDRTPIQFSIRTLLELTAIMGIVLSLWFWGGETRSRAPEFFLGLAGGLLAYGVLFRRWAGIIGVFVVLWIKGEKLWILLGDEPIAMKLSKLSGARP
jgi:hypothetical protein